MSIFAPQNPGIGGLDEITDSEALFLQNLEGLSYVQGDILYHDGSNLTRLGAGTSGYVLQSQGAGANPIWASSGAGTGLTWSEVTGTTQTAAVNNGYITNNAGLVTVTIPDTASVGDIVRVVGSGAGGWAIAQNASEIIHFGSIDSTTGTGGSLASSVRYDSVEIICNVADTEWVVISSMGNITIV